MRRNADPILRQQGGNEVCTRPVPPGESLLRDPGQNSLQFYRR
jgi:hypothetical protein